MSFKNKYLIASFDYFLISLVNLLGNPESIGERYEQKKPHKVPYLDSLLLPWYDTPKNHFDHHQFQIVKKQTYLTLFHHVDLTK